MTHPRDLPPRRMRVAVLVADGYGDRQIAAMMGVTWQCVRRHIDLIVRDWQLDKSRSVRTQIARTVERIEPESDRSSSMTA